MKIIYEEIERNTRGSGDLIDITPDLADILRKTGLGAGNMTVFVVGSTAGITTFEYEPGMMRDMSEFYERIAPSKLRYHHDETWGDANGYSHVRAAITGPSLTIPFNRGTLLLGTWQQVVLAEFDTRPRNRRVVIQVMGQ